MRTEDEAKVLDLMVQEGEEPGTLTYNVVVNGLCSNRVRICFFFEMKA